MLVIVTFGFCSGSAYENEYIWVLAKIPAIFSSLFNKCWYSISEGAKAACLWSSFHCFRTSAVEVASVTNWDPFSLSTPKPTDSDRIRNVWLTSKLFRLNFDPLRPFSQCCPTWNTLYTFATLLATSYVIYLYVTKINAEVFLNYVTFLSLVMQYQMKCNDKRCQKGWEMTHFLINYATNKRRMGDHETPCWRWV